jgi:hypothetical protein
MEVSNYINKNIYNDDISHITNKYKYNNAIDIKINQIEDNYNNLVEEINNIDYTNKNYESLLKNKSSLLLLRDELKFIKLLSKYSLQNNTLDTIFIKKCLNIILIISNILKERLNLKTLNIISSNLYRGSYKFCNFKENCKYYYEKNKKKCYQDHYVHNMVSRDILILINYLDTNYSYKEVLKSINTLSFVINHMETELSSKCKYFSENEWEQFHINNK